MSFSRLLKKLSSPSLVPPAATDTEGVDFTDGFNGQPQSSERMRTIPHPWRRKRALTGHSSISRPSTMPSVTPKAGYPLAQGGTREMLFDKPLPPEPSVLLTRLPMVSSPNMIPACSSPVQDKLAEAWDAVKDDPRIATMSKELHTVGENADAVQNGAQPVTPLVIATVSAIAQSDIGKKIKDGINKFSEGMPVFMNALDELKAVHPFIGVAVLAFKTVYTLEQKRRDNDKKVISLHIGMKDMMGSLLLLNDMENDKQIAPDGTTIEDRLKPLVESTADDIKECSNVCDAYIKKRPLAKVMLSSLWDARLLDFVGRFAMRRKEFEFELTRHTSRAVDKANIKLDLIGGTTKEIKEQMDYMKTLFEQLVSPEQKQLSDLVEAKGGIKVLRNDDKMLLDLEKTASKASGSANVEGHRARRTKSAIADSKVKKDLKRDIFEDPDTAVKKNWVMFSRKFEAQKNQIIDELAFVVRHEGDRVIQELKGKAHERIRDGSIHELWVEMGWRGNVKARHFVLALRDHFLDKHELETKGVPDVGTTAINDSTNPDAWAIKYVDIMWVQPILEAIDDDASGFITVAEVNRFTSSRPTDWSLPHWIAFWAVGFQWALVDYAQKIEDIFAKMEGVRSVVLPPNREAIDRYFGDVWEVVHTLTAAVQSQFLQSIGPDEPTKFKPYLEALEARLGDNLQSVDYVIDGVDTLALITGMGRVEKTLLPLLYLLMKRHYEIMRIMRTKILNMRVLLQGAQGILYVNETVVYRVQGLTQTFTQQKLDPEKQFENFSFGIFKYHYNVYSLWSVDYVRGLDPRVIPYNDDDEDQNVQPGDVLKHNCEDELCLGYSVYDRRSTDYHIPNCGDIDSPLKDILGIWNGYFYNDNGVHCAATAMMSFILVPAEGERNFKADGWSLEGRQTITGSWSRGEDDVIEIRFRMSFSSVLWEPMFFNGRFDPERDALTGVWGLSAELEISEGKMEFRRIPAHYFTVYPSIKELRDDKPRALWRFAIAAVRNDIRRERWSWSYFMQRRDDRKTVISLLVRSRWFGTPLSDDEAETLRVIARRLIPADAFFYDSKVDHIRANTWVHENAWCDSCHGRIGGPRLFCLDCDIKSSAFYNTLDLCSAPQCVGASVTREDLEYPHESNHRLVKVRSGLLTRSHGWVCTAACDAFGRVWETCRKIAESTSDSDEEARPDVQKTSSSEPTSMEMPIKDDKPEDELNPPADGAKDGAEVEGNTSQGQDQSLPPCGKCNDPLSFPFWYCIFCEDDLFICNACDIEGVPELVRSSGKHTEEHHLIRCLAPEKYDDDPPATSTEERLMSIETRLDGMHTQFDDLTSRLGNIEQLLQNLARIGGGGNGAAPS